MNSLLNSAALSISKWLEEKLPNLDDNWWNRHVFARLTFQQQRLVNDRKIESLQDLDLAGVLRVLDQNWHEISAIEPLPREARTWVKELQSVRNRWSHAPASGVPDEDAFRDADTLIRILEIVGAEKSVIDNVTSFRTALLAKMSNNGDGEISPSAIQKPPAISIEKSEIAALFQVGQLVSLKSNPAIVFPILEVLQGTGAETRYRVFESGSKRTYYESQLREIESEGKTYKSLTAEEFSALVSVIHLSSPTASALYSLNSGRISFVPYQYRPVFKLVRSDRPRLLIADEVGVGKTVESGLILKELQARNDIKSVLIICPKALVSERKWELEMKRFDENFTPLDSRLLKHCIRETSLGGEWPIQYEKAILPSSLIDSDLLFGKQGKGRARDVGLLDLDPPPKFDLLIVDEAHHIRNSDTYLHQAVRYFADNSEAVVFLSATPVQLGSNDLFTLLNVLRPDVVIDKPSFAQMAEPNTHINAAIQACRHGLDDWPEAVQEEIRLVAGTTWGREVLALNPGFQAVYDQLSEGLDQTEARIRTIHALEELYTFSGIINRTRRRDIGEFTTRKAETVSSEFTPCQEALHDSLLSLNAKILRQVHGNQGVKFMMTTICRQAASSLYGLAAGLREILDGKVEKLESDLDSDGAPIVSQEFIDSIRSDVELLISQADSLDPHDPKAEKFLDVLASKCKLEKNKVLVFSTFRHTLRYLATKIDGQEIRYGIVHGDVPDADRSELRRRFALPKDDENALDVLLSSEVGCEGLDFQFCDCLVNFDLPWNPMRIEQRIGRIDRYGQKSSAIAIFNFITVGTIDAEIFDRCLSRIGVFQHAIGGNEEILGEITKELQDITQSFELTEDEVERRLLQIADNKVRQIEEEERIEAQQGELFGLDLQSATWDKRMREARSVWLEPRALALVVSTYLTRRLGLSKDVLLGEGALRTLRLGQENRARVLEDFRLLPRSNEPTFRNWERWLRGGVPTISITFDQQCAVENPDVMLISLGHPLLRQACACLFEEEPTSVSLKVRTECVSPGTYPFALYHWSKHGVSRDELVVPVSADEELSAVLMQILPTSIDAQNLEYPDVEVWDELDNAHHKIWVNASNEHAETNRQLVQVRIQSLTASFRARKMVLEGQIENSKNEKIKIMKKAELARAEVDFNVRISELEKAANSGDIRANPFVFGVVEVSEA